MSRVQEQAERENRILFEIVVDAYGETERAMGWYYYLKDAMQMPFDAICKSRRSTSPLEVGSKVRVVGIAAEDDCMCEVLVLVKYGRSKLAVPLAQIECKSPDEETCQAVADWHYWVARGYEY
jgi:Calcium binding